MSRANTADSIALQQLRQTVNGSAFTEKIPSPSMVDHLNKLNRRVIQLENENMDAVRRMNSIETLLGVCFSHPQPAVDVENLAFPN